MPTSIPTSLKPAQIGKCGELLVQYRLLLLGIESAPMSTDTGIDLVVYAPKLQTALTIQVKANLKAKPGGGRGKLALDWWVPEASPAQLVALVDLSTEMVWLLTHGELLSHAQQRSSGRVHFYMRTDPRPAPRKDKLPSHLHEFDHFLLSNRAQEIFGL
ncbi:hypothetical protein [Thermomonas carbonis]|uniref:DUF4365 domain-containing protein n=1 Tax=Thermomonas carbonis TaxID=1463158 RepID=A0A7G9SLP2_9GAMM|nr:hypothetical protein [Thermomonas carbonis]QNN68767.1 hypothetical protein H9L16_08390 [Thermomonas carbonis]GHC08915.1 hypothetical protein GCM10010080_24980 [Thermomonas carbonis]